MRDFQYPAWQEPLQDAAGETDLEKLAEKVSAAETALFLRMQELGPLPEGHQESEAIREACRELFTIQTERLKWPGGNGGVSGDPK